MILIRRGQILIDFYGVDNRDVELEKMNKKKEGRNFVYPNPFFKLLGFMRLYTLICHTDRLKV